MVALVLDGAWTVCDDMSVPPADGRGFAVKRCDEEFTVSSGGGEGGPRWEFWHPHGTGRPCCVMI